MRRSLSVALLFSSLAYAAPGPLSGPSARARATPTVRTLGVGVVVDRVADGVIVGHKGADALAWTWHGITFVNTTPPTDAPAAAAVVSELSCAPSVTATPIPSPAVGWSAGLCPDGRVALRHEQGTYRGEAVVVALDGAAVTGARAVDPGDGAFGLVVWGEGGVVRALAWRAAELVPSGWRAAWMPAGPALDWPEPREVVARLDPAVTLDLTLPDGAAVSDAFVRDERLTLVGTVPQGRSTQAAVFDTPWIPVLPR